MHPETIRRVPWTCRHGRFGVTVDPAARSPRVDDVFWGCRHPLLELRLLSRGECDRCPLWEPPPQLAGERDEPRG